MSDTTQAPDPNTDEFSRLAHFPVTFFAIVMGLMGLTLALHAGAPRCRCSSPRRL